MNNMPKTLLKLIGMPCCKAKIAIGNQLVLHFGATLYYKESKSVYPHGEWIVSSEYSSWRIIENGTIIYGDGDKGEIGVLLEKLIGNSVREITQTSLYDVCLFFNDSYEVHFMGQSRGGYYLSILTPESEFIVFEPGSRWIQKSSEMNVFKFNNNEKYFIAHSERCSKRWQKRVNEVTKNVCYDCAYFICLSGGYYFSDFGLCSNEMSLYDGKVVSFSSSCPFFNTKLYSKEKEG